jgi:hypothetical protein
VLLDSPKVLGWARWRALDEEHSLGDLRASLQRLAREGRLPAGQEEILARMLLAALNEAALFITAAQDEAAALQTARAAVDTLIDAQLTRTGRSKEAASGITSPASV